MNTKDYLNAITYQFNIRDNNGNYYYLSMNGHIFLYLKELNQHRNIGWLEIRTLRKLDKSDAVIFCKKVKKENIFKKNNSFGIPYEILIRVQGIAIEYEGMIYKILTDEALKLGSFLHFKEQGIERQFFIQLDKFHKTKIK